MTKQDREFLLGALSHYAQETERALNTLCGGFVEPLNQSMRYTLLSGGKRLRASLCLASCSLFAGSFERARRAACAIEMIHAYSLIHDDLPAMDNDDTRRGKPSSHIAFGEGNAILAGDGLLTLAFMTLAETNCLEATALFAKSAMEMVEGQSLDLNAKIEGDLLRLQDYKTSALFRAACGSGAMLGGADADGVAAMLAYASAYGLLFQITDDILDVVGDAGVLGKTTGKDADEQKLTFVSAYGLDGARKEARAYADKAREVIRPLAGDTRFFEELAAYTLERDA